MTLLTKTTPVLIFIPAFNEEDCIYQVVHNVKKFVPKADILVIDDGSHDKTADNAQAAGAIVLRHPFNLGIGGAMQSGLRYACLYNYDYAIRLDGDGQHDAKEIESLLRVLYENKVDMVVGSRFLDFPAGWRIPLARRLGIWLYATTVSAVIGQRLTDATSGFCGYNRRANQVLATYLPQDYPDVESRIIVHKAGLTQVELPVHMYARITGESSINRLRSIYYAFKVTIAVLTSAMKEIRMA